VRLGSNRRTVSEDGRDRASEGAGGAAGRTTLHSALARSGDDPPGGNRDRVEERSCSAAE